MNDYIKTLVEVNKDAVQSIKELEAVLKTYTVTDEKSKSNFGNICIMLNGYRNVANASECLLINEDVLKDDKGNYYSKINDTDVDEENNASNPSNCTTT